MKKIAILSLFLLFITPIVAQNDEDSEEKTVIENPNELNVNVGYFLAGFPEFTYERLLNEESSIGLSVGFSIDDINYNFAAIPFYRIYFGKKQAAGFFIEGNANFFSDSYDEDSFEDNFSSSESGFGFGLGLAVGAKLLTKKNWTGEIFIGAGRTLTNNDHVREAYPRLGISIGKRF